MEISKFDPNLRLKVGTPGRASHYMVTDAADAKRVAAMAVALAGRGSTGIPTGLFTSLSSRPNGQWVAMGETEQAAWDTDVLHAVDAAVACLDGATTKPAAVKAPAKSGEHVGKYRAGSCQHGLPMATLDGSPETGTWRVAATDGCGLTRLFTNGGNLKGSAKFQVEAASQDA